MPFQSRNRGSSLFNLTQQQKPPPTHVAPFQSRNRGSSLFNWQIAPIGNGIGIAFQSRNRGSSLFNIRDQNSAFDKFQFQSRNRGSSLFNGTFQARSDGQSGFQSRNRGSSLFNMALWSLRNRRLYQFQSRNRGSSLFNSGRNREPLRIRRGFNLVIEVLLFSTMKR